MTENADQLDILSFGEALVDFLPDRRGKLRHVDSFHKAVGGAPANVALGLARLGRRVGFLSNVGADEFGAYLREALEREGVDVTGVHDVSGVKTGVTFVSLDHDGDRSFLFFREPSADLSVTPDDVDEALVARSRIVHLGSNLMTEPDPRAATLRLLDLAEEHGCLVSTDPNIRLHLWKDHAETRRQVDALLRRCDLIKLNDDELAFVGEGKSAREVWEDIIRPNGALALVVTHGADGAEVFCGDVHARVDAPEVEVVDTTGAGDGFVSGMLTAICEAVGEAELRESIASWDEAQWERVLGLGCACGAKVCEQLGATPGLPRRGEV
ncbi:carbohydrate kinase [Persicimonas caeni]|uniref:Carbohydrate kinase n=1 Tax=Persicimonas caeni TaxID=2292766 RepID=A0A4Y6PYZ2_PERCE|nr:carbohydrate kinase [Persicimonas caeni]QDG52955.1 carbohydrate kinase [Persicimonas caeni]QED34177.1 carbohydrate kinase [Persicimonas caeni]